MTAIDAIMHQSRAEFVAAICGRTWYGKEREAVRLSAIGYLLHPCRAGTRVDDPRQRGIEGRVLKPRTCGVNAEVGKAVVIWSEPGQTCWSSRAEPLAVLEWKAGIQPVAASDIAWLHACTTDGPQPIG